MDTNNARRIILSHLALAEDWEKLELESFEIAKKMQYIQREQYRQYHNRTLRTPYLSFIDIDVTENKITVHMEEYLLCGDTEYDKVTFPTSWFDNPNWEIEYAAQVKKEYEQAAALLEEASRFKAEETKKAEAASKLQLYLQLKKEFEEGKF